MMYVWEIFELLIDEGFSIEEAEEYIGNEYGDVVGEDLVYFDI